MKKLTYLFVGIVILCSCNKEEEENLPGDYPQLAYEKSFLQGFVSEYEDMSAMYREVGWEDDPYFSSSNEPLSWNDDGYLEVTIYGRLCEYCSSQEERSRFLDYTKLIGDTTFVGKDKQLPTEYAMLDTLSTIKVICANADFDEQHSKGSNLNDVTTIYVFDWGNVVRNGYEVPKKDGYYAYSSYHYKNFPHCIYREKLSTFDWTAHTFAASEFFIGFNKKPQNSGEYIFEVEIQTQDGKVLKASTEQVHIDVVK